MPNPPFDPLAIATLAGAIVGGLGIAFDIWRRYLATLPRDAQGRQVPQLALAEGVGSSEILALLQRCIDDKDDKLERRIDLMEKRFIAVLDRVVIAQKIGQMNPKARKPSDPRKTRDGKIRKHIRAGLSDTAIMRKVGCSRPVVKRLRGELKV